MLGEPAASIGGSLVGDPLFRSQTVRSSVRIHRGYVTGHIARDRRVCLVKSRAVPEAVLDEIGEARPKVGLGEGVRAAFAGVRRAKGRSLVIGKPEMLWYPARRLCIPPGGYASTAPGRARRSSRTCTRSPGR